jgi:hypothetical protein
MAFCQGAMSAIRKIWNEITPELENVIEEITKVTGEIIALESDITVEAIVKLIPAGSLVEGWLNAAINEITSITTEVGDLATAITAWLGTGTPNTSLPQGAAIVQPTKQDVDMKMFKLASMATKAADKQAGTANAAKTDSFYDSAVQLHVIVNK